MFIFNLANFIIVKPQIVGKTNRSNKSPVNWQIARKKIQKTKPMISETNLEDLSVLIK
jgi:hypothetical protein